MSNIKSKSNLSNISWWRRPLFFICSGLLGGVIISALIFSLAPALLNIVTHNQFIKQYQSSISMEEAFCEDEMCQKIDTSLKELKYQLSEYNASNQLEVIIGILAVIITITIFSAPILGYFTLRNEKDSLKSQNNKTLSEVRSIKDSLAQEIENNLLKKFSKQAVSRRQLNLEISIVKSEYINYYADFKDNSDLTTMAQVLEIKLLRLLGPEGSNVADSLAWIKNSIRTEHIVNNEDYVKSLRKLLQAIKMEGTINTASKDKAFYDLINYLK